jgi:hypothetical protein
MDMHTVWLWISIAWLFVLYGAAVSILIWGGAFGGDTAALL